MRTYQATFDRINKDWTLGEDYMEGTLTSVVRQKDGTILCTFDYHTKRKYGLDGWDNWVELEYKNDELEKIKEDLRGRAEMYTQMAIDQRLPEERRDRELIRRDAIIEAIQCVK